MHKRIGSILIFFVIIISIGVTGCGNKKKEIDMENKDIINFLKKLDESCESRSIDLESLKKLIDDDGIYAITYFDDGRDPNRGIHVYKDEIRDDLMLVSVNNNKVGIELDNLANAYIETENLIINRSDSLDKISFNVDWHSSDESTIHNNIDDIVNTCKEIILTNNKDIPQVFVIKDNYYVFSYSSFDEEWLESFQKTFTSFIGGWVVFEKIDGKFKLRAVMDFT
ncbi:MAG: hypothetical protein N4A62_03100 [Marinisporobacter sp.]|jgi:hypothetical protein|nr:hypothetical protein [Marinisporobacter sp.]